MEKLIIDRIIEICKDDVLDKKAKMTVLNEYLKLYFRSKVLWKRINPRQENGEYMPEGTDVIMYSETSKKMIIGFRYSSSGGCPLPNVSHWMPIPETPEIDV